MFSLLETNRAAYIELWKGHYIFDIGFEKHRNYLNNRKDIIMRSRDSHAQYSNFS